MKRFRFELSASFYASCLSDHHEAKPHDDLSLSDDHEAKPHDDLSLIQHPKDCKLLHLTAADLSRPQWKCAITDCEGCVGNQPVLRSIARPCFVRKTWRSLFGVFECKINCDVLTG